MWETSDDAYIDSHSRETHVERRIVHDEDETCCGTKGPHMVAFVSMSGAGQEAESRWSQQEEALRREIADIEAKLHMQEASFSDAIASTSEGTQPLLRFVSTLESNDHTRLFVLSYSQVSPLVGCGGLPELSVVRP